MQVFLKKIAETVGVSLGAVNRILKQSKETGKVERKRKGKCERKRKTIKRDDEKILCDSKRNPRKTIKELKRDLDESGVQILSSTIRRRLLPQRRKVKKEATANHRYEEKKVQLGKKIQKLV